MAEQRDASSPRKWSEENAERFFQALSEIALSDEANPWARERAANALFVITTEPPPEAIELGRKLAERYGW